MKVLRDVVAQRLCIGCGVCVVACPRGHLDVAWNERGELAAHPVPETRCAPECSRCGQVCPFGEQAPDEDAIGKSLFGGEGENPDLGRYRGTYVCRVADEALLGGAASGGVGTWILSTAVQRGIVDAVLAVRATSPSVTGTLYRYECLSSSSEVHSAASSVYYPVTLATVREALSTESEARLAVVGLPCFIKGLRRLALLDHRLRERLILCVGLTCGQCKSRLFTEFIAGVAGINSTELHAVRYRQKHESGDAGDFSWVFDSDDGRRVSLRWSEGIGHAWSRRVFAPRSCGFCDDTFAELGDVSLMDAWRMPYRSDPRGTSFVVVRSELAASLVAPQPDFDLCEPVEPEQMVASQMAVVRDKTAGVSFRCGVSEDGLRVPRKRASRFVVPTIREALAFRAAEACRRAATGAWLRSREVRDVRRAMLAASLALTVTDRLFSGYVRCRTLLGALVGRRRLGRRA